MFKIDLHVHTSLGGDSIIKPNELVPRCREIGLDAVCVTEHHSYFLSNPYREISLQHNFPIFQGLEYRAREGHLLIFGVKADLEDLPKMLYMQWAIDWVLAKGGVAIPAHPYQGGVIHGFPGDGVLDLKGLYALEVLNAALSYTENHRAVEAAKQLGINGVAGSDAHGPSVLGRAYTEFPAEIMTEDALVQALREGRYLPCWNDKFYGDDHLDHWTDEC
ncbi:PHP-associated domain-containing protein [Thermodesulfobacteriota bacterium]